MPKRPRRIPPTLTLPDNYPKPYAREYQEPRQDRVEPTVTDSVLAEGRSISLTLVILFEHNTGYELGWGGILDC